MDTFINTESLVPEKVDLEGFAKIKDDWHSSFIDQFEGIPVRIDETLEGGQYFIAVSRELYEDLAVKTPSTVPLQGSESPLGGR